MSRLRRRCRQGSWSRAAASSAPKSSRTRIRRSPRLVAGRGWEQRATDRQRKFGIEERSTRFVRGGRFLLSVNGQRCRHGDRQREGKHSTKSNEDPLWPARGTPNHPSRTQAGIAQASTIVTLASTDAPSVAPSFGVTSTVTTSPALWPGSNPNASVSVSPAPSVVCTTPPLTFQT